jgi:iron complex outermembrane recepter protein
MRLPTNGIISGSIVLLATISVPIYGQAVPESAANEEPALEEITVLGTRLRSAAEDSPLSVSVITQEELSKQLSLSFDVKEALFKSVPGFLPGFDATQYGTGPLLRGRIATVLINGVPVNQLLRSNGIDIGLIDANAIASTEVVRGANSAYGFGAPGGVISINTRRGTTVEPQLRMSLGAGGNTKKFSDSTDWNSYASIGQRLTDDWDYHVGLAASESGLAFAPNSSPITSDLERQYNLDFNSGYQINETSSVRVTLNALRRDMLESWQVADAYYGFCNICETVAEYSVKNDLPSDVAVIDPSPESRNSFQSAAVSQISYLNTAFLGGSIDVSLLLQRNQLRNVDFESNFVEDEYSLFDNEFVEERIGLRTTFNREFQLTPDLPLKIAYGVDVLRNELIREATGGILEATEDGPQGQTRTIVSPDVGPLTFVFGVPVNPLAPPIRLDAKAGFVQNSLEINDFILSGGIRYEYFRPKSLGYNEDDFFYPRGGLDSFSSTLFNAGLVWRFAPGMQGFLSASQGTEISELGRVLRGFQQAIAVNNAENDPDEEDIEFTPELLKSISARSARTTEYEIGVRGRLGSTTWSAAAFYSDAPLSSQVRSNPDDPFGILIPVREPQRTRGLELVADYESEAPYKFGGFFSYQEGEFRCDPEFSDDDPCSDYQPQPGGRISAPVLSAYGGYEFSPIVDVRLQGVYTFKRDEFDVPAELFGNDLGNSNGFFVMDLLATVEAFSGQFSLGIDNLLNREYVLIQNQAFNSLLPSERARGRRVSLQFTREF